MLKTIIKLPDGTELSSGVGTTNAIKSVSITECVNGAQELTLGSTCANMVEAKIIAPPEGELSIAAGDEIIVYREDEDGVRHQVGLFTTEKPTRSSANSISITAYDRVSWLDKDLTQWLASLSNWPYSLVEFASLVCTACGLTLVTTNMLNSDWSVKKFTAEGITGRQLIQWAAEAAGCFARANAAGKIEFAWYKQLDSINIGPSAFEELAKITVEYANGDLGIASDAVEVTYVDSIELQIDSGYLDSNVDSDGNLVVDLLNKKETFYYFQNSLSYEDYETEFIQKVQIRQSEEDVGTVYPDSAEALNTYIINGNYLLTASSADDLTGVAQVLYERLKGVQYTPCNVSLPSNLDIHAGHILQITDRNGVTFDMYVMSKKTSGQKDTLECTGSYKRESSTAVNNQSFKALTGKVLNLRTDVDGMKVENKDTCGRVASIEVDVEGIRARVSKQESTDLGLQKNLTAIEQTAYDVSIAVKKIQENGTSKVTTEAGYTFSDDGLIISQSGEEMENRLDNTGMYVERSGKTILQANAHGVVATDVKARNFLIIGEHARFEDYTDGTDSRRTACFWRGEE